MTFAFSDRVADECCFFLRLRHLAGPATLADLTVAADRLEHSDPRPQYSYLRTSLRTKTFATCRERPLLVLL